MRKNIFWKILAVWLMVLLSALVYKSGWKYYNDGFLKVNTWSGKIYVFGEGRWSCLNKKIFSTKELVGVTTDSNKIPPPPPGFTLDEDNQTKSKGKWVLVPDDKPKK